MIVTVVCCFSVVCTAIMAAYGISPKPPCLAFSLSFASLSILVSAVYYIIIKLSLVAMGAVLSGSIRQRIYARQQHFEPINSAPQSCPLSDHDMNDDGYLSPWSFSSDDDDDHAEEEHLDMIPKEAQQPSPPQKHERYSTFKVWTNVYGLAVGTFCIVHSLLLPSEAGGTVFCLCLWLESLRECTCSTNSRKKKKFSGRWGIPCLSVILLTGIVLKAIGSLISHGSVHNEESIIQTACNMFLPVVGVASIRNMRKTANIQGTMELSAPVCWLGSCICFLCIIVSIGDDSCILRHVYDFESEGRRQHSHNSSSMPIQADMTLRHQPILSVMVIPFPLVCAVVAVVACSQNSHIMDVAAAVFLAHSAKPFSISSEEVQLQQSQDRQHMASLLGGISMGMAACTCIGLAGFRMLETLAKSDASSEPQKQPSMKVRMRNILKARTVTRIDQKGKQDLEKQGGVENGEPCERCRADDVLIS